MNYDTNYWRVHRWLISTYGKAVRCESKDCNGKSTNFEWSLIHGYEYIEDVHCFRQLCKSCHTLYDRKPDTIKKRSESFKSRYDGYTPEEKARHAGMTGKKHSTKTKNRMSKSSKGKEKSKEHKLSLSIAAKKRWAKKSERDAQSERTKEHYRAIG